MIVLKCLDCYDAVAQGLNGKCVIPSVIHSPTHTDVSNWDWIIP